MSGLETIAKRYAQALFEIGVETSSIGPVVDQTQSLANAYSTSEDLRAVIDNPLVDGRQREAVLTDLASRLGVGDMVLNTARLLAERRRMRLLPLIAKALEDMSDDRAGIARAQIISAQPLADDYVRRLQTELERMTSRKIVLDRKVDPSLIGGVVTRLGDIVIDGSVQSRLRDMRDQLLST